jgi:hypothetical protein
MGSDTEMQLKKAQLEQAKQAALINALNFQQSRAGYNVGAQLLGYPTLPQVDLPALSGVPSSASMNVAPVNPQSPPLGQQGMGVAQPSVAPAQGGVPTVGGPTNLAQLGVNPVAAGLTFSQNPAMEKIGAMVQKANEPLINRGYGINVRDPVTGNYNLDPGSLAGIKAVEDAKVAAAIKQAGGVEAVKAPFTPVEMYSGNTPVKTTLDRLMASLGTTPGGTAAAGGVQTGVSNPSSGGGVSGGVKAGLSTSEKAAAAGAEKLATSTSDDAVKQINDYRDLSQSAAAAKRNLQSMRDQVAGGTFTGGTAEFLTRTLNVIAPALPQDIVDKIARSQVLDKNQIELATNAFKSSFGSRPAAVEFTQLLKSVPGKGLQPGAMLELINQAETKLNNAQATLPRAIQHFNDNKGSLIGFVPPGAEQTFASEKEVQNAALKGLVKPGERVIINGRLAIWK